MLLALESRAALLTVGLSIVVATARSLTETFFRMLFGTETPPLPVAVLELVAEVPATHHYIYLNGHRFPSKPVVATLL